MRLGSSGGPPTLAMLEIATAAEVPAREMDSPAVRALTEMAILVAAWDNDLHSYRKERWEGHTDQNIITVLAHHEGWTDEEAMVRAVGMRDRVLTRFLRLREDTRRSAGEELRQYLECLGHAIRGNIDWALKVPRYNTAEVAGVPLEMPGWADGPSDGSTAPLPIPGITWWWDRLAG
jgi:hypothetical protein